MRRGLAASGVVAIGMLVLSAWSVRAQTPVPVALGGEETMVSQVEELMQALVRLPLAALLACGLALRPRRLGTPARRTAVIHTQIILAVIGALVMLVVGSSLARAFGIVGAAGLVRYRAKVEDPKDAGVMLSTLAIGLAAGVGQWLLAIFGTVFILVLLWVVESFDPTATRVLTVKIRTKNPAALKSRIEALFSRQKATYETRTVSPEELLYEIRWPLDRPSDRLSERIAAMDASGEVEVEVDQKKAK
ncbi:MAG: DUF4956 domain-containing protein [Vicinamibacterales bacterium]